MNCSGRCAMGLAIAVLAPGLAEAAEAAGFGEVRLSILPGVDGDVWQMVERFRPTFEADVAERWTLVSTLEVGLVQGRDVTAELERTLRDSEFGPLLEAAECTWPKPLNSTLGIDGVQDYLQVDRLYIDHYGEHLDLRVGRQAIHWGSGRFVNPTDPFPEVLFAEPWRPRRGLNAIRTMIPFGQLNDVTVTVAIDDTLRHPLAAGRVRMNLLGVDFAAIGAWRGEVDNGLVGVDVRGTLGVGFWIEAALHLGGDTFEELSAGLDYSFPILETLLVFAEYYRNGSGATRPDDYVRGGALGNVEGPQCNTDLAGALEGSAREPFAPLLQAQNYLMLGASLGVLLDLSVNVVGVQNLDDGTAVVVPTVTWNVTGWLDLAFSGQVPLKVWSGGGEFSPRDQDLVIAVGPLSANLAGLVPDATLTLWTRASF